MYQFLSCVHLKPDVNVETFQQSLKDFTEHLIAQDLVSSIGPLGKRHKHPIMDTDNERDHEYFFIMSFRDRQQCDLAVSYIQAHKEPGHTIHKTLYFMIDDPVFMCWEDI